MFIRIRVHKTKIPALDQLLTQIQPAATTVK